MILSPQANAKNRITTSIIALVILTITMIIFIIYPSASRIKELGHEIDIQKNELDAIYARGQNLNKTIKQYAIVKPKINELNNIYLQTGEELKLITDLEQSATTTGVNLDKQLASNKDDQGGIKILPLQLTVVSDFSGIIKFIGELEKMNYYLNISNVRITKSTNNPTLSSLLLTNAFYQP